MALPTHHSPYNLRHSLFRHVKVNFEELHGYPVDYGDSFWDHDRRGPRATIRARWVALRPLDETAGQKGSLLLHVSCFGRVGSRSAANADPFGRLLELMVERVRECFSVKKIDVYDFKADPLAPTAVTYPSVDATPRATPRAVLVVQTSAGRFRVPESAVTLPEQDGVRHVALTYRLRTQFDASRGHTYDSGV